MKKIIKNKVSLTLNPQKNDRSLTAYPQPKNQITNSAYSLRSSNIINIHKDPKLSNNNNINTNKNYLIYNTSPSNKIGKNLNNRQKFKLNSNFAKYNTFKSFS